MENRQQFFLDTIERFNGSRETETRVFDEETALHEVSVARGEVIEKAGWYTNRMKKADPPYVPEMIWGQYFEMDFHPRTPLLGQLHATVYFAYMTDGTSAIAGYMDYTPGTWIDEDIAYMKATVDDVMAENDHDVAYSREKFNRTPAEYAQDLGWVGPDVWHAHCVKLDADAIALFARTRTGVAHCPCSNMRLASGIAPIRRLLDAGVPVGLGVDGSASNDGAQMVGEARQALLLARVGRALEPFGCDHGPAEMTARDALALATRGGAEVLGRADIGRLEPGLCADLALFDLDTLGFAGGAVHDPVASLLLCASPQAAFTVVHGRVVVREGRLATVDLGPLVERHNRLALQLARSAATA